MTTGDGRAASGGPARVVTRLPRRGSTLVRSPSPPAVPGCRYVDVRPGPFATFDGDRFRTSLSVRADGERRRFDRRELSAVEDAITTLLGDGKPSNGREPPAAASGDSGLAPVHRDDRPSVDGRERAAVYGPGRRLVDRDGLRVVDRDERRVVRFGDRAACRRLLPDATVEAIERHLADVATRGSAALLTWTSDELRPGDHRTHDVVLDRSMTGRD